MVDNIKDFIALSINMTMVDVSSEPQHRELYQDDIRGSQENKLFSMAEETGPGTSEIMFATLDDITPFGELRSLDITSRNSSKERISSETQRQRLMNTRFKLILFEKSLKVLAALYLSLGILAGMVYFCLQVESATAVANKVWRCVGLIKWWLSISVIILALWSKVLLFNNTSYVKPVQPENTAFFSSVVMISFAASWVHLIYSELTNFLCMDQKVLPDLLLPISQMMFTMISMMTISDLIFSRISADAPTKFYMVYKTTAVLLFIECINSLVFNVLEIESGNVKTYLSKFSNSSSATICNKSASNGLGSLLEKVDPFIQVFPLVFFVSCICILIKPLRQFSDETINSPEEVKTPFTGEATQGPLSEQGCQGRCSTFVFAVVLGLLTMVGIPFDILGLTKYPKSLQTARIVFNAAPICVHLIVGFYGLYFIKLLQNNVYIEYVRDASKVDRTIMWTSLCGLLISCFKSIINSAQFIGDIGLENNGTNTITPLYRSELTVHITAILLFSVVILQSMSQAILVDFISNVTQKEAVSKEILSQTTYPVILLISANIGFFFTNWYLLSGFSSFRSSDHRFSFLLWGCLCAISDPFTLLFRAHSAVFLFRFLSKLKYHNQ